ncbi:SPOR domain-containing protein [Sphingobium algorifonticola]|uniref:SPOR domain-containing protein n=1 Tax=Sphingobium algorifonticola TaxID=2008318 RepID=A0A437J774_9SPHN|nr:SPOR domain-containing protein [Sphingobium algorifonticola]RVT41031.1 SPOR domain-containing protein [Sphingobium algorifonticola]
MTNMPLLHMAASSLIIGLTLAGCTSGNAMMARAGESGAKADGQLVTLARQAEAALARRDTTTAITAAETLVSLDPRNAGYRVLLGRAYLGDGRMTSAESAFTDAMTLGDTGARTIVSLSLAKVALGKSADGRALLVTHMDSVPAADYGLAMAMAGDPLEAIRILTAAAQDREADAKTRQNLAYAYALAGQWREARLMAAQDLAPLAATQRVVAWAQTAGQGGEPARVAALIGAPIRADDGGLPARLALGAPDVPAVQVAQAEMPVAEPVAEPTAEPTAKSAPAMLAAASTETSAAPSEISADEVPVIRAPVTPLRTADIGSTPVARATTMMRKVALMLPVPGATTAYAVQLGAYDSVAVARERWQRMARSNAQLARFPVSYSAANVHGRLYHRLALGGFADRAAADQMCRIVRSRGGACFVRATTPDMKWAKAAPLPKKQQFAAR